MENKPCQNKVLFLSSCYVKHIKPSYFMFLRLWTIEVGLIPMTRIVEVDLCLETQQLRCAIPQLYNHLLPIANICG